MQPADGGAPGATSREQAIGGMLVAMRLAGIIDWFGPSERHGFAKAVRQAERDAGAGLAVAEILVDATRDMVADERAWRISVVYPVAVSVAAAAGMGYFTVGLAPAVASVGSLSPVDAGDDLASGRAVGPATSLIAAVVAAAAAGLLAGIVLQAVRRVRGDSRRRIRAGIAASGVMESLGAAGCRASAQREILAAVADGFGVPATVDHTFPLEGGRLAAFGHRVAEAGRRRDRRLVPVLGSLVAGLAVLAYAVALVRPITMMLERVSHVPPAEHWRSTR